MKRYKNWVPRVFILLVVGAALYISFKGTDLKGIKGSLKEIRISSFIFSLFLNTFVICIKAGRLTILIRGIEKGIKYKEILPVLFISYFYNTIFPFRGGDVLGIIILSRLKYLSKANLLGVLLVDKFIDGFIFLSFTLPILYSVLPFSSFLRGIFFLFLIFIIISLTVLILRNKKEGVLKKFGEGINTIFEGRRASFAVLTTIFSWLLQISIVYLLIFDFGDLPKWWTGIWFLLVVNLSILVVQSPGNIGTMEAGGTYSLMLLGYSREVSLSFTLLYHAVNLLPVIILGGIISIYMGFRFPFLKKSSQESS